MGNKLAKLREEHGLSQIKLAEIIGISQQTLSSWEIGRTLPKPYQMQHLEDILHIDKEKIFFEAFNYKMKLINAS